LDGAQFTGARFKGTIELDFDLLVWPGNLPRIGPAQPVVRLLPLPAVLESLLEHSVFVSQTVAHGRKLHSGHRVQEACRQAAEPAIAEGRVRFLLQQFGPIDALIFHGFANNGIEKEIGDVVGQRTADEKLHREVVDSLWVQALVGALGRHPALGKDVPHCPGKCFKAIAGVGAGPVDDVVEQEVAFIQAVVHPQEEYRTPTRSIRRFRILADDHSFHDAVGAHLDSSRHCALT